MTASTHFLQDIRRRKAEMGRRVDDLIGPGQDELYQAKLPRPVGPSCLRYWHRSQLACRNERWGGPSGGWASECPWIVYETGDQPRRRRSIVIWVTVGFLVLLLFMGKLPAPYGLNELVIAVGM